jgi:hypothetical protein
MDIDELTLVQLFWIVFAIVLFAFFACNYTAYYNPY